MSHTLFRRGLDEKTATQLSEDLESGHVLAFVPAEHLDVAGLRMTIEREREVDVYADPRLPEPVEPPDAGRTVKDESTSRGQSLFH